MTTQYPHAVWKKDVVRWERNGTLYLSVVFTWMIGKAKALAERHDGPVVAGGPAMMLMYPDGCDWAEVRERIDVDVLEMHNTEATFTTRGCIRKCKFCAVPKIEGDFRELTNWEPKRVVCDNNFLAASDAHVKNAVRKLRGITGVDFNQGLDARIFTPFHAEQLAKLKEPHIRFALDHVSSESKVVDAVNLANKNGLKFISIYVLIGFKDTPDDALRRLRIARKICGLPYPMRYQPLDIMRRDAYVGPGWTNELLKNMMAYYARLSVFGCISFDEYCKRKAVEKTAKSVFGKRKKTRSWK